MKDHPLMEHYPSCLRYARSLTRCMDDAYDLTQETFVRVLHLPVSEMANPRAYLCKALVNVWRDRYRRSKRMPVVLECECPQGVLPDVARVPSPLVDLLHSEDAEALRRAVAGLPTLQRFLFRTACLNGLSYQETAERLGVPYNSISATLTKARRNIARQLAQCELTGTLEVPPLPVVDPRYELRDGRLVLLTERRCKICGEVAVKGWLLCLEHRREYHKTQQKRYRERKQKTQQPVCVPELLCQCKVCGVQIGKSKCGLLCVECHRLYKKQKNRQYYLRDQQEAAHGQG